MKFFINQVKELCQVKKQRSFEEEERDMYFRQIESAREGLSKQEAEYIIRKKAVQDISDHQYLELKVARAKRAFSSGIHLRRCFQVDKQRASHLKYELEKEVQAEAVHQDNEAQEAARQRMLDKAEVAEETSYIKKRSADEALAFQQNMKELTSVSPTFVPNILIGQSYVTAAICWLRICSLIRRISLGNLRLVLFFVSCLNAKDIPSRAFSTRSVVHPSKC